MCIRDRYNGCWEEEGSARIRTGNPCHRDELSNSRCQRSGVAMQSVCSRTVSVQARLQVRTTKHSQLDFMGFLRIRKPSSIRKIQFWMFCATWFSRNPVIPLSTKLRQLTKETVKKGQKKGEAVGLWEQFPFITFPNPYNMINATQSTSVQLTQQTNKHKTTQLKLLENVTMYVGWAEKLFANKCL